MLIQAWNLREFLPTRLDKGVFAAHTDFLQCFQTVRDKRRANDQKFFDAALGEFQEFQVSIRLQPRVFAKARLE